MTKVILPILLEDRIRHGKCGAKDISVPWKLMRRMSDYNNSLQPFQRKHFLYYKGSLNVEEPNLRYRKMVKELLSRDRDSRFDEIGVDRKSGKVLASTMAQSRFCIDAAVTI